MPLLGNRTWATNQPTTHQVSIHQFMFEPDHLTIRPGDMVVWTNRDIVPHTATEQANKAWDTGKLDQDERGQINFVQSGEYDYYCFYHPNMKARIVVSDA